jgi:FixJ family two-component response regulator
VARRAAGEQWDDVGRRLGELTSREREVLEMVLTGIPNKAIAGRLEITERTVELRRASLMKKLNVQSTVELIRVVTQYESYLAQHRSGANGGGGGAGDSGHTRTSDHQPRGMS